MVQGYNQRFFTVDWLNRQAWLDAWVRLKDIVFYVAVPKKSAIR